ncbi:hydroxyethylthiazole kinase-like [Dendronephthya gigantea]|uniref:hydroxyethylthiazole kinase-like n=1 Tax=Dendronephthya gigantea TaxID=151771 RepID=UPI00106C48FB|nr:hydroxyethylthiazole kinase-like [Dendronephthya gigantea]
MSRSTHHNKPISVSCDECAGLLQKLRTDSPLVQCITNYVSMDIMANTLLAIGASPAMAHAEEEVEEFIGLASALLINIGTLSVPWIRSMHKVAAKARELGKPWVLDPVGVGATSLRTKTATELALSYKPTAIRGNASEIMALAKSVCKRLDVESSDGAQKGVDSSQSSDHALGSAKALALECHCVVVVTGKDDFVTDGSRVITVSNGHPVLTKITAAGCALTAVMAAFVCLGDSTDVDHVMKSCACALSVFGIAAELAVKDPAVKGPGSARMHMLDAYSSISSETLSQMAKFS